MRLHAILGQSRLHLATAIIALDWEKIFLYGSDKKQFEDLKEGYQTDKIIPNSLKLQPMH